MKINYVNSKGKRTSVTISDQLVSTWKFVHPDRDSWNSQEEEICALREAIEHTSTRPQPEGMTFVQMVESDLLADIRTRFEEVEHSNSRL